MTLGNAARAQLIVWCMTGTARREEGPPIVADPGLIVLGENKMVARAIHGMIALGGRYEEVRK
jgi:hypothetical protein